MTKGKDYYLGLDIGTDSVGYAATDAEYNLLKFRGEPVWGTTIFDAGSLNAERRSFRTSRRRLERRKQRVQLLQEIFADEIARVDERFFIRLQGSYLAGADREDTYILFNDPGFTDKDYYRLYPTIHHLICDLMDDSSPHDARLIYLACAWLITHRGHFLSDISAENLEDITDFKIVYTSFMSWFPDNEYDAPWEGTDVTGLEEKLRKRTAFKDKYSDLKEVLLNGHKPSKEGREGFPFSQDAIIRLMAGGTCRIGELFQNPDYNELGSVSLGMDDEKKAEIMSATGEDYSLIAQLDAIYDWSLLADILAGSSTISEAKVRIYDCHREDLAFLKKFIKKYCPGKYHEIFCISDSKLNNYTAYSYHFPATEPPKSAKSSKYEFSKYLLGIVKNITPEDNDAEKYRDMVSRLGQGSFLPKQRDTDNRVIPHQLYFYELKKILEKASGYLPFLSVRDEDGITPADKILSIFKFRIPYFVGPLNSHSKYSWLKRRSGRILPWNISDMVDFDASEERFIQKMTNTCTYLPGEPVLPRDSLLYQRFMVLNEINNIRINGLRISVDLKQNIYNDLFMHKKKVTRKSLINYLIANGYIGKGMDSSIEGIDDEIKSGLSSHIAFRHLISDGVIKEKDAERMIRRAAYAEDKTRFGKWLGREYPGLSKEDHDYICRLRVKGFGRLSERFLMQLEGMDKRTGEITTVLRALWETGNNLMELLSDNYTFAEEIAKQRAEYYAANKTSLAEKMDKMYLSNTVRRQIFRTLAVVKDVCQIFGPPEKIFVEMTRSNDTSRKGIRTSSRRQQIMELYDKCMDEDVRLLRQQLEEMGEYAAQRLQKDQLFLYFMQFGKCIYTGETIKLEQLGSGVYDIEHIYPQSYVKDDSIINNKVLVRKDVNGEKSNSYPVKKEIRDKMRSFWDHLKNIGAISAEKHSRLIRTTPFTEEEKYGFINRQLTETSQSAKAVATLLKERCPDAEIVYVKAGLVSDFRHEFKLYKSRSYNDLHHAVDAYLNIAVGNVYHMRFSRQWFSAGEDYSINTKPLFTHEVNCRGGLVWGGKPMLARVKKTAERNNAHFTKYAFFKTGGLFDQNPVKKAESLVQRKKGMPAEVYGGYNKPGVMFYIPTSYRIRKKKETIILSVELMYGIRFLDDEDYAKKYAVQRLEYTLGKTVDEVSFPLGLRPWKVNTVLSLDGFRVCITGTANKGAKLSLQSIVQFSSDPYWKFYLKKLEAYTEKLKKNPGHIYDAEHDKVTAEKNMELYDLYIDKLRNSIYSKRMNSPVMILVKGRVLFEQLTVDDQSAVLLNIHQVFGRMTGGCDLRAVGGKPNSAVTTLSSSVSNWKKYYRDIRLIDSSPSGLREKISPNLLEIL